MGSYAWCGALGNPWCGSGFSQEHPSNPVTASLAQGEGEDCRVILLWGGQPLCMGGWASVGMYKNLCVHMHKGTPECMCMCVNVRDECCVSMRMVYADTHAPRGIHCVCVCVCRDNSCRLQAGT